MCACGSSSFFFVARDTLPLWDPKAASDMALDVKTRSAARLLAAQVWDDNPVLSFDHFIIGLNNICVACVSSDNYFWNCQYFHGQVRDEAAHLEHERRALRAARSSVTLLAEYLVELQPPLPLPPTSRWIPPKPPGCGPTCGRSHTDDGDCLVCGRGWGNHSGHNCSGGHGRGSWRV